MDGGGGGTLAPMQRGGRSATMGRGLGGRWMHGGRGQGQDGKGGAGLGKSSNLCRAVYFSDLKGGETKCKLRGNRNFFLLAGGALALRKRLMGVKPPCPPPRCTRWPFR